MAILKTFEKFKGKHVQYSSFSNKVAFLDPNFITRKTSWQMFSCHFEKFSEQISSKGTANSHFTI